MSDRIIDADDDRSIESNHRSRRSLLSATGGALAMVVSGCLTNPWGPETAETAGDDPTASDEPTDGRGSSPDSTGNETDDGASGTDETNAVPPLEREPAQVVAVAPDGFQFDPDDFEIDAGETVHWIWKDSGHNLRIREKPDGSDWEGTPGTGSDTYDEGYEHGHTFETPGEYQYFCAPHQTLGLEGSFTVR